MLRAVTNAWMTTTFEQQLNHHDQHHHHYLEDLDQHDHLYCLDDLLRQPSQPPLPSWYRRQSWKPCLKTFEATPKIKSFLKTMHIHPPPSYLWCHHFDLEASVGFYIIAWNCWHLSLIAWVFSSHFEICLFVTRTPKGWYQCHKLFSEKPKSLLERLKNFRT